MSIIVRPNNGSFEYGKVALDEWIMGVIEEVQTRYDQPTTNMKGEPCTKDQVRFKLLLDGYEFPYYSRWMTLSTHEKSNLYIKYINKLFGAKVLPDTVWDLEKLRGLKIKVMYEENTSKAGRVFQNIAQLRATDQAQIDMVELVVDETEETHDDSEETAPF